MVIIRINMNAIQEKRTEVMQTLLSMVEPTENEKGCMSFQAFRDIEDKNGFELIAEWKTREDLDHYIRSDRFSVLLGTKSLLCEPPQIEILTVSKSEGMETVNAARGKRNSQKCTSYGKNGQILNRADGLIQFVGHKVVAGKNFTT